MGIKILGVSYGSASGLGQNKGNADLQRTGFWVGNQSRDLDKAQVGRIIQELRF